jgi:phosphoglucosamine mutase
MAISALELLKKGDLKKNTLVVTHYSNAGLDEAIKKAGGKVVRVETGDWYVAEEMLKRGYNLGGEKSGHIIFFDCLSTGDGILTAVKVAGLVKEQKKALSELANCMKELPQVLLNVEVKEKRPLKKMPVVQQKIRDAEQKLNKRGRVFIRYSGTQNILRILVEGKSEKEINELAQSIAEAAKKEVGA